MYLVWKPVPFILHCIKKVVVTFYRTILTFFTELWDINSQLWVIKSDLRDVKSELHDKISQLRVIKSELRDVNLQLQVKVQFSFFFGGGGGYILKIARLYLTILTITRNCEFMSRNSEKKSELWVCIMQLLEKKSELWDTSCNYLLNFVFSGGNGLP